MAGGQFLPGEFRQTARADPAAVAGPVFLSGCDLAAAQGAAQGDVPSGTAVDMVQGGPSFKNKKDEKSC